MSINIGLIDFPHPLTDCKSSQIKKLHSDSVQINLSRTENAVQINMS